jgi:hypothetical protein
MYLTQFAVYLGKEKESGFSSFIAEKNLFLVIEIESGLSPEKGREILKKIKENFHEEHIRSLIDFDTYISTAIQSSNLPASYSLAAGFQKENILYIKTVHEGIIYAQRKNQFTTIIQKTNIASGYIQNKDYYIFTTKQFANHFAGTEKIKQIIQNKGPAQIVNDILPELKSSDDSGIIALFLNIKEKEEAVNQEKQEELFISKPKPWESLFSSLPKSDKKRTITFISVIVIVLILIWSVIMGNQRRNEQQIQTKLSKSKTLIEQQLNQAQEVSFLNLPQALTLIAESKKELQKLKTEVGSAQQKEIDQLQNLINTKESAITKKEEKKAVEYYDLAIDDKNAQGVKMYLQNDTAAILDKQQGIIYLLSLSKKSLDKKTSSQAKSAKLIAYDQGNYFLFVENQGIFKIGEDGKTNKIIEADKDWGTVIDMNVYNGNIYLLDVGKDEIYKYISGEKEYSQKSSYFKKDQATSLKEAKSLAIDGSVYIAFEDYGIKYTTGVRDDFKTSFPEGNIFIEKLFTTKELDKIYGWDKKKGSIYVLGKNGTYEKQINATILKTANDVIVYNKGIYALEKSKIYKISED